MAKQSTRVDKTVVLDILRCDTELSQVTSTVEKLKADIHLLEKDLAWQHLEEKWAFDKEGKRAIADPETEAWRIAEQLKDNPELKEDVINTLKQRRADLMIQSQKLKPG